MQCLCNSWCVKNILVMVLRLIKSLKLAEIIMSLHPHQAAQAHQQFLSFSTVYTALVVCGRQCQRRTHSIAPKFHAERSTPHTAGNLHISNYTILNTIKLQAKRIGLFAESPDWWNPLRVMNSMLTKIQLMTSMCFPTSNMLKTLQS